MGPIKDWITNPDVGLAFNIARGATAAGAAFMPGNKTNPAAAFSGAEEPFQQALNAQNDALDADLASSELQAQQALTEANVLAQQKAREGDRFRQQQALGFSAAGVMLEGSPMLVLEETSRLNQQEIDAINERGKAQATLIRRRGLVDQMQGRASLLGEQSKFKINQANAALAAASTATNPLADSLGVLSGLFQGNSSSNVSRKPLVGSKKQAVAGAAATAGAMPYKNNSLFGKP